LAICSRGIKTFRSIMAVHIKLSGWHLALGIWQDLVPKR
jgi:hypothetical protein